jgi:hypothetical protein
MALSSNHLLTVYDPLKFMHTIVSLPQGAFSRALVAQTHAAH